MKKEEAELEAETKNRAMSAKDVYKLLCEVQSYQGIFVPEYTFGDLRIDAIKINIGQRTVTGFEIKVAKADFKQDKKWQLYSEFCSSLSIVCPPGLIKHEEIEGPFGLLWVGYEAQKRHSWNAQSEEWDVQRIHSWKKKAKNLADTNMYQWLFTYIKVLEKELPRLAFGG